MYYSAGVGSTGGFIDRLYGGISGDGVAESVRQGYSFLCTTYRPGDEIFLFGFSRGAFTARAIGGLIAQVGILTREGERYLSDIYADVLHRHDPDYIPKQPNKPFRNKPSASNPRYRAELAHRGLTILGVNIKVVGVWETVGSLGVPRISWLEKIGLQGSVSKKMSFYDTRLSPRVENAFQALALDEKRASFTPCLWQLPPDNDTTTLCQVWFPGVHSNVVGGYPDQELANITLAWMMSRVRPFLSLDLDYVLDETDRTDLYYERDNQRPRPWSFGKIYNSIAGIWVIGGTTSRTPGRYHVVDPRDGRTTDVALKHTNEYVHASVRARLKLGGPGYDDVGEWKCHPLKEWRLVIRRPEGESESESSLSSDVSRDVRPPIYWELPRDAYREAVSTYTLPEAPLAPLEREVLAISPDERVEEYVLHPEPEGGVVRRGGTRRRLSRMRK